MLPIIFIVLMLCLRLYHLAIRHYPLFIPCCLCALCLIRTNALLYIIYCSFRRLTSIFISTQIFAIIPGNFNILRSNISNCCFTYLLSHELLKPKPRNYHLKLFLSQTQNPQSRSILSENKSLWLSHIFAS